MMYRSCAAYDKRQNGQAERMTKYISEQIKMSLEDPASLRVWTQLCPIIGMKYNCGWVRTVKNLPFTIVYGKDPAKHFQVGLGTRELYRQEIKVLERRVRGFRLKMKEREVEKSESVEQVMTTSTE